MEDVVLTHVASGMAHFVPEVGVKGLRPDRGRLGQQALGIHHFGEALFDEVYRS